MEEGIRDGNRVLGIDYRSLLVAHIVIVGGLASLDGYWLSRKGPFLMNSSEDICSIINWAKSPARK
jgi:hypothetical protein